MNLVTLAFQKSLPCTILQQKTLLRHTPPEKTLPYTYYFAFYADAGYCCDSFASLTSISPFSNFVARQYLTKLNQAALGARRSTIKWQVSLFIKKLIPYFFVALSIFIPYPLEIFGQYLLDISYFMIRDVSSLYSSGRSSSFVVFSRMINIHYYQ